MTLDLIGDRPPKSLCAKIYGQMKLTEEKSHSETQLERKFSSQLYARGF